MTATPQAPELEQLACTVAANHLSGVKVIARSGSNRLVLCAVRGTMSVGETEWNLELRLPRGFPSELPKVYVAEELAGRVEHVGDDGHLCVLQDEGVVGDYRRSADQIDEVLQRTRCTLENLAAGPQPASVLSELEAYCKIASRAKAVPSYFEPGSEVLPLRGGRIRNSYISFSRDDSELDRFLGTPAKRSTHRRAVYVPLKDSASASLTLPLPFAGSARVAREFIQDHCADPVGLRKAQKKGHSLIVLGFPRRGQWALVALDFGANGSSEVAVLAIERSDYAALAPRGGADGGLAKKRVMVVGCGAVGGYVAHQLAKTGVGRLVLVDDDSMRSVNLFRHFLGMEAVGKRKASALAKAVRQAVPFCETKACVTRAEVLIENKPRAFREVDLVVLATGDPAVELRLSDALRRGSNPPLVAAWVEPLGLGGHVFAAGRDSACLRCLFEETLDGLTNRSSFAVAHQNYAVTDAGCGGAHTPFSNSDAVRTADLAVQAVTALLSDPAQGPLLRSWKGDPTAFLASGYAMSPRFNTQALSVSPVPCGVCSVCGSSAS